MITNALISYLSNETISINNKYEYLEKLNLSYTDLFELKNIFVDNGRVNRIIHCFLIYQDSVFENKMKMQDRKL